MELGEILTKVPDWLQAFALVGMCLTFLATVIVRITPSKTDDAFMEGFGAKLLKFMAFFPTLGMNPRTKMLEQAYKEYLELKKEEKPDAPKAG